MSERTRQTILAVFLAGILVLTVGAVWLFAAQRRAEVTALGQRLEVLELGFAIRMPAGWKQRRSDRGRLVYRQPLTGKAAYDSFTRRRSQRRISFIAIRPNASDAEVLIPLDDLVRSLDKNDNLFHYPEPKPFPFGPWHLDSLGYERRDGTIIFRNVRRGPGYVLIRYEQIRAKGRVFWCVIAGNTPLGIADKALLDAVSESFRLLGNNI